jgi:GTP-binding protein
VRILDAVFLTSSVSLKDSPSQDYAEVVFMGRSNVGKSSLLNSLCKRKNLAKSSSTPGKTKLLNFFDVKFKTEDNDNFFARFVDLPGFGYAKVSKEMKQDWSDNLTRFLEHRLSIRIFVHLIDSRHTDLEIDEFVDSFIKKLLRKDQFLINVYTKSDKLGQSEITKIKNKDNNAILVSNLNNKGIDILEAKICEVLFGNNI